MYVWKHRMHRLSGRVGAGVHVVFKELKGQCGWSSEGTRERKGCPMRLENEEGGK